MAFVTCYRSECFEICVIYKSIIYRVFKLYFGKDGSIYVIPTTKTPHEEKGIIFKRSFKIRQCNTDRYVPMEITNRINYKTENIIKVSYHPQKNNHPAVVHFSQTKKIDSKIFELPFDSFDHLIGRVGTFVFLEFDKFEKKDLNYLCNNTKKTRIIPYRSLKQAPEQIRFTINRINFDYYMKDKHGYTVPSEIRFEDGQLVTRTIVAPPIDFKYSNFGIILESDCGFSISKSDGIHLLFMYTIPVSLKKGKFPMVFAYYPAPALNYDIMKSLDVIKNTDED